jgi:hypothetical protein
LFINNCPLVSEIVPASPLPKIIVSPAADLARADRKVPDVKPSLRFKTVFVAASLVPRTKD